MAAASDHVRPWQRILIGGCHLDDYECTTVAAVRSCCQDFLKGYDELSAAESTDVEASAGLRLLADALLRRRAPHLELDRRERGRPVVRRRHVDQERLVRPRGRQQLYRLLPDLAGALRLRHPRAGDGSGLHAQRLVAPVIANPFT